MTLYAEMKTIFYVFIYLLGMAVIW